MERSRNIALRTNSIPGTMIFGKRTNGFCSRKINDERGRPSGLARVPTFGDLAKSLKAQTCKRSVDLAREDHAVISSQQEAYAMAITFESIREFVRTHQEEVTILAGSQSGVKILKNGSVDVFDLIDKATDFVVSGTAYAREDFEELMSR